MLVVFALILLALVLFATERFPIDVTAILIMVLLMVLEPWTQISPREGISGFANPATITVLAMLILSTGINRTGLVQLIGRKMAAFAGTDRRKQLAATNVSERNVGFVPRPSGSLRGITTTVIVEFAPDVLVAYVTEDGREQLVGRRVRLLPDGTDNRRNRFGFPGVRSLDFDGPDLLDDRILIDRKGEFIFEGCEHVTYFHRTVRPTFSNHLN